MVGVFQAKKLSVVSTSTGLLLLLLLQHSTANALPLGALDSNILQTLAMNEPEYFGIPSPLTASSSSGANAVVVAKTLADMDDWKRKLLEEASRYRGLAGTAEGGGGGGDLHMGTITSMASPVVGGIKLHDLLAGPLQQQPPRTENERQMFCAYVSNDYTEQMRNMLERLEVSCNGVVDDRTSQCEMARNASRQFVNVIQLIQHSVCPDLGLL